MDKLPNIVTGVLTVMGQRGEAADAARAIIRRVDRRS
jgi:cob(I)alamin adenosyltransferase